MRMDLTEKTTHRESFAEYVYGSAEVVGLMCLEAFSTVDHVPTPNEKRWWGARAWEPLSKRSTFLRDLGADVQALGRSYFPGVTPDALTDEVKNQLVDDIEWI
jgi:15-cis-phytoene synthase